MLTSVSTLDPVKILFPVSEADYLAASQRIQETMSKPLDQRPEIIELILADGSTFPNKARLLSVDRQVQRFDRHDSRHRPGEKSRAACCGRDSLRERASLRKS